MEDVVCSPFKVRSTLFHEAGHDHCVSQYVGIQNEVEDLNRWTSGALREGVEFSLNDSVQFESNGQKTDGSVISLLELSPEPGYLVRTRDGENVELAQSALVRA